MTNKPIPCPECKGTNVRPSGEAAEERKVSGTTLVGVRVVIECQDCGEKFGEPVFVADDGIGNAVTVSPPVVALPG